ncbi:MAG: glycerol kinase GlpK [Gammaproteobacteria bacterium]|nr:glycerol kinase GlpK [Gammaproteobacteria bacterium]MYF31682.1 glycerol kinase GlpK [Gammaproteobacteria bacterium]MYK46546.1 glycerol kinase GlpK [Gammaproteobacteria bacterium]
MSNEGESTDESAVSYLLAIDQGTSSSRAIVFDAEGRVAASAQRPFDQVFPQDGWVEQDPEALWQSTLAAAREAIAASGVAASSVAAIGIANQRETTLVWDAATGEVAGNAIVWQDRRTAERCERARGEGMEPELVDITGLLIDPYFSSTKLEWLLAQDDLARRARAGEIRFGTVDSFLIWRLTKGARHVTDATNASRTQLFDIGRQVWSERLLDYFDVPVSVLPEVQDCVGELGIADAQWFGAAIPICGVAGDQQAALIGQACFAPGLTKSTYGTGCFLIANTGRERVRSRARLLTTVGYRIAGDPCYAVEGSIFNAGVAIKWLRDKAGLIETAAETEAVARRIGGDTGGVYVVPAFTGLGAPHWRPDARGLVTGLTLDTGADEIVTATLKSVAFQTADLLAAADADGVPVKALRVDGGMVANDWFCQFLADVTDLEVARPDNAETTVVGAGLLAAVGAGMYADLESAAASWQLDRPDRTFTPHATRAARSAWLGGWHAAVQRALSVPALDPLTGLLDRRGFMSEAGRRLQLADRRDGPLALLYIDLDRFKQINDGFGHAVGDAVLHAFARVALEGVRDDDVVARIGGEEFVILLDATPLEGAKRVAERIRTEFRRVAVDGLPDDFAVTLSVGIAASVHGENLEAFMARADAALYEAKAAGRDCVRVHQEPASHNIGPGP